MSKKTEERLLSHANNLAREFYRIMGYKTAVNYKMYNSKHPTEKMCWNFAVLAYERLVQTDLNDTLSNIQ